MFNMVPTELIVFSLIALVIFVAPAAAISFLVWQAIKRKK
jgi:hypothetical protein